MTGGFFAILDDIAVLLDDAAVMSKVAAKKTAGILGDDLAVNAEKATGFRASRELPVLWAITKGSFINKLIILPIAFLLSAYASWLIVPILLLGGMYLSYEGVEKIYHVLTHRPHEVPAAEIVNDKAELLRIEKSKIKSAIITDFILSIEIVMIALGTVMEKSLLLQIIVVSLIAIIATVGVYGVVAILVRMDDTGFFLIARAKKTRGWLAQILTWTGSFLVASLPRVIRALSIIGTIAMLLVGGGIFTHNLTLLHHVIESMPPLLVNFFIGLVVGATLLGIQLIMRMVKKIFFEQKLNP
jgi:predicted DNA repair protein MutK